ncbi:MAG: hydroxyectoine utilization dehydratase EutB [Paracoccaceae bacterium]
MTEQDIVPSAEIHAARSRINGVIRRTAVEPSATLSEHLGKPVFLKLEHQQASGSFKFRGASNAVARLDDTSRANGVIAVSTGNHGRGLARACRAAGVKCTIVMSRLVPANKVDAIRTEGAEVVIYGQSQDEAQQEVDRRVAQGATMIPPFDHSDIIAGQGTLGLELLEQVPDLDTVFVQLSGGGLIAGVAAAIKSVKPQARIIGVCMERGAAMAASLRAGQPTEVEELPTLADSLGGGIGLGNRYTFAMAQKLVDDVILLSETEIAQAIRHCYWQERQIVEGAAAVGVGAILANTVPQHGTGAAVAILSGGNIDMRLHHRIISGENVDLIQEST